MGYGDRVPGPGLSQGVRPTAWWGQKRLVGRTSSVPAIRRLGRPTLAALLAVVVLGAALRLYRLDEVPAFVDEDMYTTVAVEMTHLSGPDYFLHSTDSASTGIAKTPLVFVAQAELTARGLDPLIAGRAISALSGVISIPLVFWLGHRIGGAPVGLLAAGMYAFLPLAVLHERMVLQDGPTSAAALVADLASGRGSIRRFVLAGVLGALAVQLKVTAVFVTIVLTRIALVGWGHKPWRLRAGALLMPAGPASSYLALMLAPTGPGLAAQNAILAGATPPVIAANLAVLGDTLATYFPFGLCCSHRLAMSRWPGGSHRSG